MVAAVAAVDLGATSGRVMLGYVGHNEVSLRPVARFPNNPVRIVDGLHWNILDLYRNVTVGLASALRDEPDIRSIAVDSWAVDYALLRGGRMLGNPYHYRDSRTATGIAAVNEAIPAAELYAANGLQFITINTVYQLAAERLTGATDLADSLLLVPDLVNYWLTGAQHAEITNASTTGLLNVHSQQWDETLIERLGLPRRLFASLLAPGQAVGELLPEVAAELGARPGLVVNTVGSHDTASAVVAVPATTDDFAYISSGTWSLVGLELEHPIVTEKSRAANFTNEAGVDGRVRFLQNASGLWLLSESVRQWEREGQSIDLSALLAQAEAVTTPVTVFDATDLRFEPPGDMPARIAAWCSEHGRPAPASPAEFVRSIIESLAEGYAVSIRNAVELSGKAVSTIHIVGGGSQNALLCQLTANHTGLRVLAGPVEATAMGNVLIQARAQGLVSGDLETLRAIVATQIKPVVYEPAAR